MKDEVEQIEQKIHAFICTHQLLPEGCTVVVGLSGGADSMMLTHYLHYKEQIPVLAAHVNHGLRGAEADADEQAVVQWCANNQIPLKVLHADVARMAQQAHEGLEECGRRVRYDFFNQLAQEQSFRVATAHTLSDQTETVLLHLAQGAGAKGLCGILPLRGKIVRPLLPITRTDVEIYCKYYNLAYVTDQTNFERIYARNKIRLDIVPVLKELNPSFETRIYSMTESLQEDTAYLEQLAQQALQKAKLAQGYRTDVLAALARPVLMRALSQAVQTVAHVRMEHVHLEAAANVVQNCGSVTVPGGIQILVSGNTLFVAPQKQEESLWQVPLQEVQTQLPDGRVLYLCKIHRETDENTQKFHNLLFNNLINYDTITNSTLARNRRSGDFFRPAGRGMTKSLKKLLNEAKIPVPLRSKLILLENDGELLWAEGFGASEIARVTEKTKNIAEIRIRGAADVK